MLSILSSAWGCAQLYHHDLSSLLFQFTLQPQITPASAGNEQPVGADHLLAQTVFPHGLMPMSAGSNLTIDAQGLTATSTQPAQTMFAATGGQDLANAGGEEAEDLAADGKQHTAECQPRRPKTNVTYHIPNEYDSVLVKTRAET